MIYEYQIVADGHICCRTMQLQAAQPSWLTYQSRVGAALAALSAGATQCARESDGLARASSIAWGADRMGRTSRPQGVTTGYATDYSVAAGRLARAATATEVAGKGCRRYCTATSVAL